LFPFSFLLNLDTDSKSMADSTWRRHPTLSRTQVDQYFDRIHIAQEARVYDVKRLDAASNDAYGYLLLLQTHHLAWVPFENLSLHYATHRAISLHPDTVFDKIVISGSRGGYCMELSALFGRLLRTLGFELYATGARVCSNGKFGGW
jgi:arylamine N-acetyltransferase